MSVCGRWLRMCERGCRCDECEFEDKEEEEDDDEEEVEEKARKWIWWWAVEIATGLTPRGASACSACFT